MLKTLAYMWPSIAMLIAWATVTVVRKLRKER
jgi:hypothetical protein